MMFLDGVQQVEIINQGGVDWMNIILTFLSVFAAALLAHISGFFLNRKQFYRELNYRNWREITNIYQELNKRIQKYYEYTLDNANDYKLNKNVDCISDDEVHYSKIMHLRSCLGDIWSLTVEKEKKFFQNDYKEIMQKMVRITIRYREINHLLRSGKISEQDIEVIIAELESGEQGLEYEEVSNFEDRLKRICSAHK